MLIRDSTWDKLGESHLFLVIVVMSMLFSAADLTDLSFLCQVMDMGRGTNNILRAHLSSISDFIQSSEKVPLLDVEGVMNETHLKKNRPPRQVYLSTSMLRSRPALLVVGVAAVCFGVCAVFLHPHKVGQFAVYVHRRLFDNP